MARAPFPDVTGLRLAASARAAFAEHAIARLGAASYRTRVATAALERVEQERRWERGTLVCAAFSAILFQYLAHECDEVELDAVVHGVAAVRVTAEQKLAEQVSISLRTRQVHGISGPAAVLLALDVGRGAALRRAEDALVQADVSLALVAYTEEGAVELTLLASPSVHVSDSARLQLQQTEALLETLLRTPDAPVQNARCLPSALRAIANPEPVSVQTDIDAAHGLECERLEDQFLRRARTQPDVAALACCTAVPDDAPARIETWTYAQLETRSREIAALLLDRTSVAAVAAADDAVVALRLDKSMDMYAAILGVARAGAAWCPIDPEWPAERQRALLVKSGAVAVLTAGDAAARALGELAPPGMRVVRLEERTATPAVLPEPPRRSAALAYKIWTSGTTGLPKAVGIPHSAAVQGMRALQAAVPTTFGDAAPGEVRFLQFAAYVFDLSIFDIFYAWGHGGTVCFAPLQLLLTRLVRVANALQVTHTLFTPAVSAMVPRAAVPSMRMVINGGEKLSQVVADEWTQGCGLVNIYGPAEATLSVTMRAVPEHDQVRAHNIGVPFPTAGCIAVDAHLCAVARGAIGELLLSGPQLARGYIGDADKTAERFVEHPEFGRVYRTGDLVRILADGQIEYLGRNDDQVKIHGVRIELLEINAAVKSVSPAVKDADTMALPGGAGDEPRIVAFVVVPGEAGSVLRTDAEALAVARELRAGTQKLLPAYMVPAHFVVLSSFPRTSSAKIDRRAVSAAFSELDVVAWESQMAAGGAGASDAALASPLAERLRAGIALVCSAPPERITPHVPFTALGLNSIRAMQLAARLADEGMPVSAAELQRHDSLTKLLAAAEHSQTASAQRAERATELLRKVDAAHRAHLERVLAPLGATCAQVLPVTPLQQSMLLESSVDPRRYWVHRVYALQVPPNAAQLREALARTAADLACLRTGFVPLAEARSAPVQDACDAAFAPLYVAGVWEQYAPPLKEAPLPVGASDADVDRAVLEHASPPGNACDGQPPFRALLLHGAGGAFLALTLHHALYDAHTLEQLAERLGAYIAGGAAAAAPPPLADALPALMPLSVEEQRATLDVWTEQLAQYPRAHRLEFPTLLTERPAASAPRFARSVCTASTPWTALEQAAAAYGTSIRPLAQLACARVLAAYMDTECVLLGDVVSQRQGDARLEHVGGPLLATLPVPVDLRDRASVAACVARLQAFHRAVLDHAAVPLPFVRQQIACPRERPLFECMFLLEVDDEEVRPPALGAWRDVGVEVEHPLAVEVRLERGRLVLALNYRPTQIEPAYAELLLAQLDAFLAAYAAHGEQSVGGVPESVLGDARLVAEAALRPAPPPRFQCVAQWCSFWAHRRPDAVAVEFFHELGSADSSPCTYAELDAASAALARALRARCAPHAVVGVDLPRSAETYVSLLGILRAGLVYLPLDETLPAARKQLLVQDSEAACVLTTAENAEVYDRVCAAERVEALVAAGAGGSAAGPGAAPATDATVHPDDVAYILYTSGSTGQPKGCILTHGNLAAAIDNLQGALESALPESDAAAPLRLLARSAEAFDVHLCECFIALKCGATIVTMPRAVLLQDLGKVIATGRVTHACVVPSLFYTEGRRIAPADVPTLRALTIGGEKLPEDVVHTWGGQTRVPMLNAYGPTEATIGISAARVRATTLPSCIGAAFPGNQFVVLVGAGEQRRLALRGEAGELCIVGSHVGRGYVKREEAQRAAFFTWRGRPAYATGDMARLGATDEAEYLGRMGTSQVKVRGARVELDEVDAAVRRQWKQLAPGAPTLHTATLLLTHPQHADARLVTFTAHAAHVPKDEAPPQLAEHGDVARAHNELHAALRESLSSYMVPSVLVPLTSLPLARVSAKVDGRMLAGMYAAQPLETLVRAAPDAAPSTPQEHAVLAAVQHVLRPPVDIGVEADLFGFGLESLAAVRLAHALGQRGVTVAPAEILARSTVRGIAAAAARGDRGAPVPSEEDAQARGAAIIAGLPEATRRVAEHAWPCVPLQEAMLSQSLAEPARRLYVNHVRFTAEEPQRAATAWAAALEAHSVYRSVFCEHDRRFVQVALRREAAPFQVRYDAAACTAEARDAIADEILAHLAERSPVRLTVFGKTLCVSLHHAVYDAVSFALLHREVDAWLHGTPPAGSPAWSYARFAQYVAGAQERAEPFWERELDGMVFTPFPNVSGRQSEVAEVHETTYQVQRSLPELQALAKARGVTLHALVLAAFASLLAQYVGEEEVTLGLVLGGRVVAAGDLGDFHGPCITTVPFRWRAPPEAAAAAQHTNAHLARVLEHQFVNSAAVARKLRLEGPLFDVLFSFLTTHAEPDGTPAGPQNELCTGYPVALEARAGRDALTLQLVHTVDRLPDRQAALLVCQVEAEMLRLLDGTPPEASLLAMVPATEAPEERDSFLARFRAHAAETPQAPALVFAERVEPFAAQTLCYAELDAASDAFAHRLRTVRGPAVFVHLPRSVAFYVALLATWKAHKTYVPLDPTLPAKRLAYMIEVVTRGVGRSTLLTETGLPGYAGETLTLQALIAGAAACAEASAASPPPAPPLAAPATILFTSGSTGKPKGVQISHRAIASVLLSWRSMLPTTRDSRLLQLASPGFDVSLGEVCLPLASGFAVATAPRQELLADLELALHRLGVTVAMLPAALASVVRPEHAPPLAWLLSGGDVIDDRVLHTWGAVPNRLINAYGPTEATIGNTLGFVSADTRRSVVGEVYPTSALHVLAANGAQCVYAGAVGEIAFAGPQLGDGYVAAPELTAAKFTTLPSGERVYRTGDRGRLLCNGQVECLGRTERGQVKINGQRVELDEIAAELASEPGVLDAHVQYLDHRALAARQLVAFLTLGRAPPPAHSAPLQVRRDADAAAAAAACVRGAGRRLAAYMVPAHTLVLAHALPLTPNNKVDHARLAALFHGLSAEEIAALHGSFAAAREQAEPASATERSLAEAIAEFCGVEPRAVRRDAPFYSLGIDSLSAIRLVRAMRERGVRVSVNEVLQSGTVRRLADAVESGAPSGAPSAYRALVHHMEADAFPAVRAAAPHATLLPCTPLQSGMLSRTVASGGALYMHTLAFDVVPPPERCAAAWQGMVDANAILRTTFHFVESAAEPWVQAVHPAWQADVVIHPVGADASAALAAWRAARELDTPAGFARAPHALHLFPGEPVRMVLCLHHALYDAHALGEILGDLDALLGAAPGARPPARPPFEVLLPHLVPGEQDTAYWLDTLQGYVPRALAAPGDAGGSAASLATGVRGADATAVCQRLGVSFHALATLAFARLLRELTGSADVCFGQVVSLRSVHEQAEQVLGPALNTVPTRVRLDRAPDEQLAAVQAATDAGRPHRHAALHEVARGVQRATRAAAPLLDALLDVQQHGEDSWRSLVPHALHTDAEEVQYALNVAVVLGETVQLESTARRAFAGEERLQEVLARLGEILGELVTGAPAVPARALGAAGAADAVGAGASAPAPTFVPPAFLATVTGAVASVLSADGEVSIPADTPLSVLGIDSIAAIRVAARARDEGLPLLAQDLVQGGTPAGAVAAYLARQAAPAGADQALAAPPRSAVAKALGVGESEVQSVLPLSAGQQLQLALWVNSGYRSGIYSFAFRARQALDPARLASAWAALQERHPLLRSVFLATDADTAVQATLGTVNPLGRTEANGQPLGAAVSATMRARISSPPGAGETPLAFADLVAADDGSALVLTLHHAMYDAWSLALLVADLGALYVGAAPTSVVGIEPMLRASAAVSADGVRSHWQALSGAPPCLFVRTPPRRAAETFVQRSGAAPRLISLARALALQPSDVMLAAWAFILGRYIGTMSPTFGVYHHGRTGHVDAAQRAAPTLNVLPLTVRLRPGAPLAETAAAIQKALRARASLEQASIPAVYAALGMPQRPHFDSYINVLVGGPPSLGGAEAPWDPMPGAGLELLAQREPARVLSNLDGWAGRQCVAPHGINLDAQVSEEGVYFALRCPADTLSEHEAEALLGGLIEEVETL